MLKTRIIPILLVKGNSVVKTVQFDNARMVGDAITNVKVFSSRMADEMVIVDIEATDKNRINDALLKRLAKQCIMPLAVGGGITSFEDAEKLFRSGADKVVLNSEFYRSPAIITEIADRYGQQAVVFSLDVKMTSDGSMAVSHSASKIHDIPAIDAAIKAVNHGAGEIILNSVDRDGMMDGYDLKLINEITNAVDVPVIAAGGCGSKEHCVDAIRSGASAVAAGSIFYWIGESIISLKEHMNQQGIEMRLL